MRIGLYGRALANGAGIGRYSRELFRSLLTSDTGWEFRIFGSNQVSDQVRALGGGTYVPISGTGGRLREEQWSLPRVLASDDVDLFHNPDFTLPIRLSRDIPAVVTVHDVAYLRLGDSNSIKSKALLGVFVPRSVQRANAIITVSSFSKREIVDAYGVDPEKVHVIPNAVSSRFAPQPAPELDRIRKKYDLPSFRLLLYVGGVEERKNLVRLAQAVRTVPGATLAVAGGNNRGATEILARCSSILGERLQVLGYFPDEDLPSLYASASLLVYPSVYEGFGIPPVEAMACGTPTAVSCATSIPEAVGDAAIQFDPYDVANMAETIQRGLEDEALREDLQAKGLARAAELTWSSVAKQTITVYRSVVGR